MTSELRTKNAGRGTKDAGPRTYACYGRVYRVERAGAARMFWAVGRARGLRASFLDRLGPRQSREQMQAALDAWAARRGLRPMGS